MKYIVREADLPEHSVYAKQGAEYATGEDAIDAAVEWYQETGNRCEIYIQHDNALPCYSGVYTHDADCEIARRLATFDRMTVLLERSL